MKQLPTKFRKFNSDWHLLERVGDIAIFRQDVGTGRYNVCHIVKYEACQVLGRTIEAGESILGETSWGKKAWTFYTREQAEVKFKSEIEKSKTPRRPKTVAVLFARKDSIYKQMQGCDVFDIERDARTWPGGAPIVAHPPCRAWGQLSHFAKPRPDEKELAVWAVQKIRENGGVLEHPKNSRLWAVCGLPKPGQRDKFGGWTLQAPQKWWGHKAEKETRFYVVGCQPKDAPEIPFSIREAEYVIGTSKRKDKRKMKKECSKKDREGTPVDLAKWLVELAIRCKPPTKLPT